MASSNPKLKKVKLPSEETAREVYDVDAAHSINGYSNAKLEGDSPVVTFANTPLTETEINNAFPAPTKA